MPADHLLEEDQRCASPAAPEGRRRSPMKTGIALIAAGSGRALERIAGQGGAGSRSVHRGGAVQARAGEPGAGAATVAQLQLQVLEAGRDDDLLPRRVVGVLHRQLRQR